MMDSSIDILIVDDTRLVNEGIAALLNQQAKYNIIGQALSGKEALRLLNTHSPQVVVLDHQMPGANGLEVMQQIRTRHSDVKIIVLTYMVSEQLIREYIQSGVEGFLLKHDSANELVFAIDQVMQGEHYFSSGATQILSGTMPSSSSDQDQMLLSTLTPSELEIFGLIGKGQTVEEISKSRKTSLKTVRRQKQNIMDKLDVHKEIKLMRLAIEHGLG